MFRSRVAVRGLRAALVVDGQNRFRSRVRLNTSRAECESNDGAFATRLTFLLHSMGAIDMLSRTGMNKAIDSHFRLPFLEVTHESIVVWFLSGRAHVL
jgi:hypothetical protein